MNAALDLEAGVPTRDTKPAKPAPVDYGYECAQADRVAERATRKTRGDAAHKATAAAWLTLGAAILSSLVLGFVV